MIAQYDSEGRIFHVIQDPIPPGMAEHLTKLGLAFVEIDHRGEAGELARNSYVLNGDLLSRPALDVAISVSDMQITVDNIPSGSQAVLVIDPETPLEVRETLAPAKGRVVVALDEPGPIRLIITPPFPLLEAIHDIVL